MSTSTFVLIPGSWHTSGCWQRLIPLLEAHGHRVITPDLAGTGNDHTPLSQVNLTTWVDQVTKIVQEQATPVILVGHSRGGLIIGEVAQRISEQIKLLVYLTAFLIPSGKTLKDMVPEGRMEDFLEYHADGTSTIKADKVIPLFYNTTPSEWTERLPHVLCAEPMKASTTPTQLTDDRFGRVPRAYIQCTEDHALLPALQRRMYERLPCKYLLTLNTDHSAFFSAPADLATHLLELATKE